MGIKGMLRRAIRRRTSLADGTDYVAFCDAASRRDDVFAEFRRQRAYTKILEHCTPEHGAAYLQIIEARYPHLVPLLPTFAENDRLGSPLTHDYGDRGVISPSTLRYVKMLGDLEDLFGSLSEMDIIEIGGGYGGQCAIIDRYCGFRSYTLVDLEPCLRLARRYLDASRVSDVRYAAMKELSGAARFDLVISNYAFTECTRPVQDVYFDTVLARSTRGYLTCNVISSPKWAPFTREELLERLHGARVLPEDPLTHERNFLLVWGEAAAMGEGAAGAGSYSSPS